MLERTLCVEEIRITNICWIAGDGWIEPETSYRWNERNYFESDDDVSTSFAAPPVQCSDRLLHGSKIE